MNKTASTHLFPVRVYYEDTDAGGVVYHTNYLKFAERARTEWLRAVGANHRQLLADDNLYFVVKKLAIDYCAPARLDDLLDVSTEMTGLGAATLDMRQTIRHEDTTLANITVTLVTVTRDGKALRLPKGLREKMACLVSKD
ncbi:MAG: tol-pal system-associated acyl-CoA thioesterase [Alphaproteobacteria bacterium]|nr:tol-pal system-associated acyl-CoA thioesterase [Alphaproteobacteria bacterium]